MSITLTDYLKLKSVNLSKTKLHIIRDPSASKDWGLVLAGGFGTIVDIALRETEWNPKSKWKHCENIVVLIDLNVRSSPYKAMSRSYLLIGLIGEKKRNPEFIDEEGGEFDNPAWKMRWQWVDNQYIFVNPNLSTRGFDFWAIGDTSASADNFQLLGRKDNPINFPIPVRLRGTQLSFSELKDRLALKQWRDFLDTTGVYLIQVYSKRENAFYQYIGMAKNSLSERWQTYVDTYGTAGSTEEDGNKYLSALHSDMGGEQFCSNWRIQVIRNTDKDDVRAVESEMKKALCTYHPSTGPEKEGYQSRFGRPW